MATRKSPSKKATSGRQQPAARRALPKVRAAKARVPKARAAKAPSFPKIRAGVITHTELASADPGATKAWCEKVLGWKFMAPMPMPSGPYHMWTFGNNTGGGLRANNPPEAPGAVPYCEVPDIKVAYEKALKAGATEMLAPDAIPGGMGWIAIVQAPGGVTIGFWAPK